MGPPPRGPQSLSVHSGCARVYVIQEPQGPAGKARKCRSLKPLKPQPWWLPSRLSIDGLACQSRHKHTVKVTAGGRPGAGLDTLGRQAHGGAQQPHLALAQLLFSGSGPIPVLLPPDGCARALEVQL